MRRLEERGQEGSLLAVMVGLVLGVGLVGLDLDLDLGVGLAFLEGGLGLGLGSGLGSGEVEVRRAEERFLDVDMADGEGGSVFRVG